jgi:hypothetical protein
VVGSRLGDKLSLCVYVCVCLCVVCICVWCVFMCVCVYVCVCFVFLCVCLCVFVTLRVPINTYVLLKSLNCNCFLSDEKLQWNVSNRLEANVPILSEMTVNVISHYAGYISWSDLK